MEQNAPTHIATVLPFDEDVFWDEDDDLPCGSEVFAAAYLARNCGMDIRIARGFRVADAYRRGMVCKYLRSMGIRK